MIRNALTLLVPDPIVLDSIHYWWFKQDGTLLPLKYLKSDVKCVITATKRLQGPPA